MILALCPAVQGNGLQFDSMTDDRRESTLTLGYGDNMNMHDDPGGSFQYTMLRYRFGKFTSPRNETAYEISGGYHFTGRQNFQFVATIGYRHYFMMQGRSALAYDVGIGGMHLTRHVPEQGSKTNFNEYAGVTFQYALTQDSALTLGYRFTHSSNAGLSKPNGGLNVNEFNVGYMWLY